MKPNFRKQLEEVLINYRDKRFSLDYKVKRPTVNEITNQILTLIKKEFEEMNIGIRRLSGQWEAQTKDWREGNQEAFRIILNYIDEMMEKLGGDDK